MHKYVLLLHLLAATVWTGGHLVLALCLLPGILRRQAVDELLAFEAAYERLGMAALAVQVLTGLWLAWRFAPDIGQWFSGGNFIAHLIQIKLALLAATAIVAVHTRRRVLPTLSVATLPRMARRIRLITTLAVLFVVTGVSFRVGPWF